jgi:penicillin amidase
MILSALVSAWRALLPRPTTLGQRLEMFPTTRLGLKKPLTIHWNAHQIPWIHAQDDRDAAVAIGLVHAHLRLTQLMLLKHAAYGRLAELAGPMATGMDHALRILDLPRAAPQIETALPGSTLDWLAGFVAGLNTYQEQTRNRPPEFALLGLRIERWTVRDIIVMGRLVGADVNWLIWGGLLRHLHDPSFSALWQQLWHAGLGSGTTAGIMAGGLPMQGSNAMAVTASRSHSGGALLASDPHLGMALPNAWILAGLHAPHYHGVGLMPVGLPFFAIGRNPHLAWGGTNLRALATELHALSPQQASAAITEELVIKRRLCWPAKRARRSTSLGPIISDARVLGVPPGQTLALRWVGHEPSDEFSAMLGVLQAGDVCAFRRALASFSLPGQNMLAADRSGSICHVLAAAASSQIAHMLHHPILQGDRMSLEPWLRTVVLPSIVDPPQGFVASANNRPSMEVPLLGLWFSAPDRILRLEEVLGGSEVVSLEDLQALQQDTLSLQGLGLAQTLARCALARGLGGYYPLEILAGWDGRYGMADPGPVVFEAVLQQVATMLYGSTGSVADPRMNWGFLVRFIPEDLQAMPMGEQREALRVALNAAGRILQRHPTWGSMHRLRVEHMLGRLPGVGRAFRLADLPTGGSRETLMKTSHRLVHDTHDTDYGSQARFSADLADLDASHAVLFGGQDGWWGSTTFADQVSLWRDGKTLQMPLRLETVQQAFPIVMQLMPS